MTDAERFWSRVDATGDGCWEWQRARLPHGYGLFRWDGRQGYAHRFSWIVAHGAIPAGMWVLHRCDNPSCVRPDHLFLGTPKDNALDRQTKGRGRKDGPPPRYEFANALTKLSNADVLSIRAAYHDLHESQSGIARRFAVSVTTIHRIVHGWTRTETNHELCRIHHWGMWHPTDEAGNRHERRCIFCGRIEVEYRAEVDAEPHQDWEDPPQGRAVAGR